MTEASPTIQLATHSVGLSLRVCKANEDSLSFSRHDSEKLRTRRDKKCNIGRPTVKHYKRSGQTAGSKSRARDRREEAEQAKSRDKKNEPRLLISIAESEHKPPYRRKKIQDLQGSQCSQAQHGIAALAQTRNHERER